MKIAINGFGRIGRLAFRKLIEKEDVEIVGINDLSDAETLAYLLKYDSIHGNFYPEEISFIDNYLIFKDKKIEIFCIKDPAMLPWKKLNVDIVLECSGVFTSEEKSMEHIKAGAKKVLISAPAIGNVKTIVYNVNDNVLNGDEKIISAASCTTNCLAPVLNLLHKNYGVKKGYMTTIHAYTNDQATLDIPHKKGILSRRGRAAAASIIPSSTGAASAIGKVIPELNNKLDGLAYRVPVQDGSVVDLTIELNKIVSKDEINQMFKNNQNETIKITMDPIVSSDIIGSNYGAIVDGLLTNVIDTENGQLVKIVAWYDNEMSYTSQMIRTLEVLMK